MKGTSSIFCLSLLVLICSTFAISQEEYNSLNQAGYASKSHSFGKIIFFFVLIKNSFILKKRC